MIITIDGPSGAGKTTVAGLVARELELPYLPSGVFYRAAAWAVTQRGIALGDEAAVSSFIQTFDLSMTNDGQVLYKGQNMFGLIDDVDMGLAATSIALYPAVRNRLTVLQRKFGRIRGCVIEGRSTAIEIFPDATVKIWLTANIDVRLKRKQQAAETLEKRDAIDRQRLLAPIQIANGAFEVDSTGKSVEGTVHEIVNYCRREIQQ